jgi:CHASE2 domain-containing sensor protein
VFISYRRADTGGYAGRLADELRVRYGDDTVFWDIDTIQPGVGLEDRIRVALADCAVLLVLVGSGWLDARNDQGRRLADPQDYVRREVAWGLSAASVIRVIPVLVEGATMPAVRDLPDELAEFPDRVGVELRNRTWDFDLQVLGSAIDEVLYRAPELPGPLAPVGRLSRALKRDRELARRLPLTAVAVVACLAGLALHAGGVIDALEAQTVDQRFALRASTAPSTDMLLIGVDQKTLERSGGTGPSRALHAELIDRLSAAGVKAIGYDYVFTHLKTTRRGGPDDRLLSELANATKTRRTPVVIAAGLPYASQRRGQWELRFMDQTEEWVIENFETAQLALARLPQDRRTLAMRHLAYAIYGKKTFSVAVAEVVTGKTIDPAQATGSRTWIDYAGPAGTYPEVSFVDVTDGRVPASRLRGRTVLVGPYDASLGDVHPTPKGRLSGVEVEANAIDTLRRGSPLRSGSGLLTGLAIVLLGACAPLAAIRLGIASAIALTVVCCVLYAIASQVAFAIGAVLVVVYPLLAATLGILGTLAVHVAHDRRASTPPIAQRVYGR